MTTIINPLPPDRLVEKSNRYLKHMQEAIAFVFRSLLNVGIKEKKIYRKRLSSLPNDIIIKIDYEADIKGFYVFFLSLKTAFSICETLVPGMDNSYFDRDHLDVIGEIGNMISGNAISRLKEVEDDIKLSPPELVGFHEILAMEKNFHVFSCNYEIEVGRLGILLAIRRD